MSRCHKCGGAGFIEYETRRSGGFFATIQQCCDIEKYSAEIKRRMGQRRQETTLVPLKLVVDKNKDENGA